MTTKLSGRLFNDNTVSPLDFGAVGDGATDDTAAVQRAIDHLETATGAKILDLRNHNYKITSQLTIQVGDIIIRDGKFTYSALTVDNRAVPMIKISPTTLDDGVAYALDSSTGDFHTSGGKCFRLAENATMLKGNYMWVQNKGFDFIYKGVQPRAESPFPRSDRAFKGELFKIKEVLGDAASGGSRWPDKRWETENVRNLYYNANTGTGEVATEIRSLTMLEDIVFDNVEIFDSYNGGNGFVAHMGDSTNNGFPIAFRASGDTARKIQAESVEMSTVRDKGEAIFIDAGDSRSFSADSSVVLDQYLTTEGTWIPGDGSGDKQRLEGMSRTAEDGVTTDNHSLEASNNIWYQETPDMEHVMYAGPNTAIYVEQAANFKMRNCKVVGFGEAGVVTQKCWEPEFSNSTFGSTRPKGSGGLVMGQGTYKPYIHDCKFTGYTGITLGTTGLEFLVNSVDFNIDYMGIVSHSIVKNNTFDIKGGAINIKGNAFFTYVTDNHIQLSSTFYAERYNDAHYNRNWARGIDSNGVHVEIARNTITGCMEYGVKHKQIQKMSGAHTEQLHGGVTDIGDNVTAHVLFHPDANVEAVDGSVNGNRHIGNEQQRFTVIVEDNQIKGTHLYPSETMGVTNSNLVSLSHYGIFIDNQTITSPNNPDGAAVKLSIQNNHVEGQLANVRVRVINGRYKTVNIRNNVFDASPYLDRLRGTKGLDPFGNTRLLGGDNEGVPGGFGKGLSGFYDDETWQDPTNTGDGNVPSPATVSVGVQKASGLCLMFENYKFYTAVQYTPEIKDVDISNNVFYRSQKLQDIVADTDSDPDTGGYFEKGGTSSISVWYDVRPNGAKLMHWSLINNRFHHGGTYFIMWASRRSAWVETSYNGRDDVCASTSVYSAFSTAMMNFGSIDQTEGEIGLDEFSANHTLNGKTGTLQTVVLKRYNSTATGTEGLYGRMYGGGAERGIAGNGTPIAGYFNGTTEGVSNRFQNIIKWS